MKPHLTALFIILFVTNGICQKDTRLIESLNTMIKPITTLNPEDGYDDLLLFKEATKDADIIGIGESTHGTALYDLYRRRLMRFLVQEMGYKAIVDEGDILAIEKLDDYINYKTDKPEFIGNLRPVIADVKEIDWLRSYNKDKPEAERVHIYGMEVRGFYGILERLKEFGLFTAYDKPVLEKFTGDIGVVYKNLSKEDFDGIKKIAERLGRDCNSASCSYYISLLDQQIDFAWLQRFGKNDFNVRDKYMFENVKSIISKTPGNKVIILAHNGHLQKTKLSGLTVLGYRLNNFYDAKYFVLATDFNTGNVNTYNSKTGGFENRFFEEVEDEKAVEYYFKQCKYPNFMLPVSEALKSPVTKPFITKKVKMLRNMSTTGDVFKFPVVLSDNYDFIAFINNTLE
ncbi:MAG: erythromycin esterase family protein [Niabella sp.]